jgi:ribosomal protein L36
MKVKSALKLMCKYCQFTTRKGVQRVKCTFTGRHNQRKGFSTLSYTHVNLYNNMI